MCGSRRPNRLRFGPCRTSSWIMKGSSKLGDAFELTLEEGHHGRVVRCTELVVDRLDFTPHASNLGRGDVVVDHALGLELADRLARDLTADDALIVLSLDGGLLQQLLLCGG